jgi:hypothetical protein
MNTFPSSNYPPFGYNDNNFNRKRFPSNVYPKRHIGITGNPNNHFNPLTTNEQKLMNDNSMTNFNQAYSNRQTIIEPINYINQNNLIHNNIADNVLDEHIVEYRINIDSLDRDIRAYPNPFNFKVKFNPPSSGVVRSEVIKKGKLESENRFVSGPPRPHINKEFKNVKYVKLDNVILPQFSNILIEDDDVDFDPASFLVYDRYIALVIKELDCNRIFCTSDGNLRVNPDTNEMVTPPKPFAHIFPDKLLGRHYYTGTPYYGSKIFKNSLLGNINSMTIQLYNSCGNLLKYDNQLSYDELKPDGDKGQDIIPPSDLRHPLNKYTQIHLSFIVGVVESQINTNTKFEY